MFNDLDFKKIFPLMTFESGEEETCRKYMETRGIYLYKQVYDALATWMANVKEIKYKQFSNLIRYDKGIRDKLYIYLAAAEEYLRNIIFEELEIDNRPQDSTKTNLNINDLRTRTVEERNEESNLYYYSYAKNFNFGLIEKVFQKFKLAEKYGLIQSDIKEVRELLRNKVMHHSMLLLSCFTDRQDIEKEIKTLEKGVEALYKSLKEIAEGLERDGIASPSGRETWHPSTVKSILQNEKYKGDCHLQKTYLPDFLSPRRIKNEGFAQSWYVEDSHAAIISKETFDMVQQEFQNRQSLRSTGETGCGKFSGKYPFSGMIVCDECGETYRRHQQYNKYKKYYIWVCKRHENNGAEYCKSRPIKEETLEKAFVRALNELIGDKERILEKLQSATVSEITDSCATAINEANAEIEKLQEQMMELLMKRNNGEITDKEYEQQSQQVGIKIDQLLMRKEEILSEQGKVQLASYRIEEVTKLLQTGKILEEFDRVMFKSLVRKITVLSNKEIEIEFECGITVRETL